MKQKLFKEIMTKNFSKLTKDIKVTQRRKICLDKYTKINTKGISLGRRKITSGRNIGMQKGTKGNGKSKYKRPLIA